MSRDFLRDALEIWAPTWPRRVTRNQLWASGPRDAERMLRGAEGERDDAPYISVYPFPEGHTSDGNAPLVDTLFVDFDFDDGDYVRGSGDVAAWRRDMSHLLVRARRVARYIRDNGRPTWRASLSGHKGIHLFLDFPAVEPDAATLQKFAAGMNEYATELIDHIADETGLRSLSEYVDVTSSDMGRLCRVPNTLHNGATESFGEERYCVPVTIDELAGMTVDDYIEYTSSPRPVPWDGRTQSDEVGQIVRQHIQNASPAARERARQFGSSFDSNRVARYREQSNDSITLDDVQMLTSDRPCVWRFHERDDKFQYGNQSHIMELFCIREMVEHDVPIDVMKEFFANAPEYNPDETEWRIEQVIARDYNRFNVSTLHNEAPELCGYDDCGLCQRVINESV